MEFQSYGRFHPYCQTDRAAICHGTYTTDGSEQVNPDDALETRNHFAAFRWILDHADEPVDRDMVCHLHAILKQGTRQVSDSLFNVGGYKTRPNFIGNPVTPTRTALPQDVPEFMDRLFDMCTKLEDEPYQIARVHWTFEKIHPFSDGNGRIGRLIMFKELLRIDALPVLVHDAYRAEYVNGISKFPDEPGWLVDTLLFERDLYRSHVLKTDAEALRYTYHDQWNMAEHRVERDEDLEFAKLIDTKAQPLFDEEYQQRERLLWGE